MSWPVMWISVGGCTKLQSNYTSLKKQRQRLSSPDSKTESGIKTPTNARRQVQLLWSSSELTTQISHSFFNSDPHTKRCLEKICLETDLLVCPNNLFSQ